MGFFSWKTQDTHRSIANIHSHRDIFPVTMLDDKGNRYTETAYGGYGIFGNKDYYVLFAEMNGITGKDDEEKRNKSIHMIFDEVNTIGWKFPNLVEDPDSWVYTPNEAENCKFQGFFYDNDIYDDYDEYGYEYNDEDE